MSVSSKTAEMNALKRAQLCDQQRLRAKIHTVYSQDIYLVVYQIQTLVMIEKQRKLSNKPEKHECFFKNSRNERTKTGTTL